MLSPPPQAGWRGLRPLVPGTMGGPQGPQDAWRPVGSCPSLPDQPGEAAVGGTACAPGPGGSRGCHGLLHRAWAAKRGWAGVSPGRAALGGLPVGGKESHCWVLELEAKSCLKQNDEGLALQGALLL